METSLLTPSWGNSQPWTFYVASGTTLENIRKDWIAKNKEGIKGNSDIEAGHRNDFSDRCQKCMNEIMQLVSETVGIMANLFGMLMLNYSMLLLLYILQYLKREHFLIYLILVQLKCL